MVFALAGNQNSGKTTLFNQLTGSNQHVGNFPGVTVERKDGTIKGYKDITLVDLPGIYSLSPFSKEEIVSRDFIINQKPSAIINIVDATNIERSLFLTLQLIELGIPMVIALNMMDEMRDSGSTVDIKGLEEGLGVPVFPISASKNEGVAELLELVVRTAKTKQCPKVTDFCSGPVHRTVHSIRHIIEDHAERVGLPDKFAAAKIAEGDDILMDRLELSQNEKELIEHDVKEMETEMNMDREAAMADMRYTFIDDICAKTVKKSGTSKAHERSIKIDAVLTHKKMGNTHIHRHNAFRVLAHIRNRRNHCQRRIFRRYRQPHRACGCEPYKLWNKRGSPFPCHRRCFRRHRKRSFLPTHNRDSVLLSFHAGGQRIYGPGGVRYG